jgi:voltage-gated potassium channel
VVSPYSFVGHRIAQSFLRPNVLTFLDIATRSGGQPELEIEEVQVEPGSLFVGQTIESARIRQEMGAIVLAIKHHGAAMSFNPPPDEPIRAGDFLIAMGSPDGLRRLEQSAARRS